MKVFVLDLHRISDGRIVGRPMQAETKVALLLLKHGRQDDLRERLRSWSGMLKEVRALNPVETAGIQPWATSHQEQVSWRR